MARCAEVLHRTTKLFRSVLVLVLQHIECRLLCMVRSTSADGRPPLCAPVCSGIQGKEQGDERCRGSQEDSGAQREFWGKYVHCLLLVLRSSVQYTL